MSPVQLNLVLEKIIRDNNIAPQDRVSHESSVTLLVYVDDLVLIHISQDDLRTLFGRMKETAKKVG
jgi:hypothetical protein